MNYKKSITALTVVAVVLASHLVGCSNIKKMVAARWFDHGLNLQDKGNNQGAIDAFSKAIAMDPAFAKAYQDRGVAYSSLGNYSRALADFNKVLSMNDPQMPLRDTYREIGVAHFRMGSIDDAIIDWQTGLRFAPGDPSLLNNLSVAFLKKQRYDDAEAAVRQGLSADPNMPFLLNSMGEILMTKKDYEGALKYFLAAIEREPEIAARYWNAALAATEARRYDIALQYVNKYQSMESDPGNRQKASELQSRIKKAAGHR